MSEARLQDGVGNALELLQPDHLLERWCKRTGPVWTEAIVVEPASAAGDVWAGVDCRVALAAHMSSSSPTIFSSAGASARAPSGPRPFLARLRARRGRFERELAVGRCWWRT